MLVLSVSQNTRYEKIAARICNSSSKSPKKGAAQKSC
jgi:hypothetical protein